MAGAARGGGKNLVGGVFYGEIFLSREGMSKYLVGEEDSPPFSPEGKPLYIYICVCVCVCVCV